MARGEAVLPIYPPIYPPPTTKTFIYPFIYQLTNYLLSFYSHRFHVLWSRIPLPVVAQYTRFSTHMVSLVGYLLWCLLSLHKVGWGGGFLLVSPVSTSRGCDVEDGSHEWSDGRMDIYIYGGWSGGRYIYMYVCTYVCMCVCSALLYFLFHLVGIELGVMGRIIGVTYVVILTFHHTSSVGGVCAACWREVSVTPVFFLHVFQSSSSCGVCQYHGITPTPFLHPKYIPCAGAGEFI